MTLSVKCGALVVGERARPGGKGNGARGGGGWRTGAGGLGLKCRYRGMVRGFQNKGWSCAGGGGAGRMGKGETSGPTGRVARSSLPGFANPEWPRGEANPGGG